VCLRRCDWYGVGSGDRPSPDRARPPDPWRILLANLPPEAAPAPMGFPTGRACATIGAARTLRPRPCRIRQKEQSPMSMHPQLFYVIPTETEPVARAAFPKGCAIMQIRDELGMLLADQDFAALFSAVGQPAYSPSRLLLITIFQFMEGLTDRQAADAVRRCMDWKYALGLELTDAGFHFSVLSEFRDRLVAAEAQLAPLDHLLSVCRARGLIKARGKQRTDATHVLAAIRTLNRLECLGETLAHTLQQLMWDAPAWAKATLPAEWYERYAARFDAFRLPSTALKQAALAEVIGHDGRQLLSWVQASTTPPAVQAHEAVALLRQVWIQQFYADADPTARRLRTVADLPPAARL